MEIATDRVVGIYYTLKGEDGEVLDTQTQGTPLEYLHGHGQIVPGLERALEGKAIDSEVKISVPPEDGYGTRDEEKVMEVGADQVPDLGSLEVGAAIIAEGPGGARIPLWVKEIGKESVKLDGNHPLAGTTLHFEVTVKAIRDATAEELDHGHVHGPGGHAH